MWIDSLKFDDNGLIPAVVQDVDSKEVLMMGFMNRDAVLKTQSEGRVCFWSRSRQKFWIKGETSGHFQWVKDIAFDCDGDTLLIQVEQRGCACHEGYKSCFFRSVTDEGKTVNVTEPQLEKPDRIYGKKE